MIAPPLQTLENGANRPTCLPAHAPHAELDRRLSAHAPAEFPVHPFERYGLKLVEDVVVPVQTADLERDSFRAMRAFDWALLTGLAVIELAYLAALAHVARWALRRLIGI